MSQPLASTLQTFAFLVAVPSATVAIILASGRGRWLVGKIALCALLLPFISRGIWKLWVSPVTPTDFSYAVGAAIEAWPTVLLFMIGGLPGLVVRRSRSRGYYISTVIVGLCLLFMLTAGRATEGDYPSVLEAVAAYFVVVLFASAWQMSLSRSDGHRSRELKGSWSDHAS